MIGFLRNQFRITRNGIPLEHPKGRTKGHAVYGDEQAINHDLWESAIRDLECGVEPPLYEELLLDGRYFASISNWRRSVFETASACEQAKEIAFKRFWFKKYPNKKYRRGKILSGYDLPEHLDDRAMQFFNRSYRREYPDGFRTIEDLWNARGDVAHGGEAEYHRSGQIIKINREKAVKFVNIALHCVRWLEGL